MPVPVSQMWTVASYVVKQKLKRRKHFPVVLMLEPLMRCNLACAGCGKIQYPAHILNTDLRPEGWFKAVEAIREGQKRGFRVTTTTTLFEGADPKSVRDFFDEMMDLGVEGLMLSPGYTYDKAPDQEHFLSRKKTRRLFRQILSNRNQQWKFNMSPLFLEFLMGRREYRCTPWGMPTYNIFGWQKPCYLLQDGYADTFGELIRGTKWEHYGTESGNPKCANCMVHSGYETSAVNNKLCS